MGDDMSISFMDMGIPAFGHKSTAAGVRNHPVYGNPLRPAALFPGMDGIHAASRQETPAGRTPSRKDSALHDLSLRSPVRLPRGTGRRGISE
ncbi:hypothetical protein JCM25156A_28430 [Komagataeibacter kakiaceti JCM 25156]